MKQDKHSKKDRRTRRVQIISGVIAGSIAVILALAMILAYVPGIGSCSAQASAAIVRTAAR